MRLTLAVVTAAALAFSAGVGLAQQSGGDPGRCPADAQSCDVDGDGAVSILDLSDVAARFGQMVGTPEPCADVHIFPTALGVYSADGTHVADLNQGQIIPTEHPAYARVLAGSPVSLRPCLQVQIGINTLTPTNTPTVTATATP